MLRFLSTFTLFGCSLIFAAAQVQSDRLEVPNGGYDSGARVAEVNGYPAPKRILDLADALQLTQKQKESIRRIYNEMHERTTELGKYMARIEQELNDAFKVGLVVEKSLRDDAEQIGKLQGRLRGAILVAHLRTRAILTAAQLDLYKKLGSHPGKLK